MDKINKIKIQDVTYEIGGGGSATVDSGLSTTSENAVQNKVITSELEKKLDKSNFQGTIHGVFAKYNNFGGAYYGTSLHIQSQYTGATLTEEVTDKKALFKLVGYTGNTSIPNASTGLYAIFRASDLGSLKNQFTNGKAFTAYICNPPSDSYDTHALYSIYQDLGGVDSMRGKQYVMTMGSYSSYSDENILNYARPTRISNATFDSLYATYSGDTSTMFFASWSDIRNAFESSSPSWSINGGQYDTQKIFIYSSSIVSYYGMEGERKGFYVKFIEPNDFTDKQPGNTINLQYSMNHLYGASDLDNIKTDIASNKTKIDSLETKVVYAEPDSASTAHIFTKTINGENIYTTKKNSRDMKVVNSVNGKTGAVNLTATVNGQNIIGSSINVYGDWNINDTSNTHYIHNRPFYQENPTYGDPIYLFKGTDYSQCNCTNTTLQKDIAEGVLEAPFQDYTCYKEGSKYVIKRTEHISNPPSYAYGYWDGSGLTSGSSWSSHVANAGGPMDMESHAQNNFYVEPEIEGVIHKLDNKFIQAKTINGESVLGDGEIDMSSYQTKTEAVKIARLTQAEYDQLTPKDNNTLYIITDAQ